MKYHRDVDHAAPSDSGSDRSVRKHATSGGSSTILFDSVQAELRSLAGVIFSEQQNSHTLQPTALVNEVWLKLAHTKPTEDKSHFLALAAKAMRQILIDYARQKKRLKRGGSAMRMTLDDSRVGTDDGNVGLIEFSDALEQLGTLNERHARVAEMRLLGSLSIDEIAGLLDVSEMTVKRDWQAARRWLMGEMYG